MAITGKFDADFASFQTAVDQSVVKLVSMESGASKVEAAVNRVANSLEGGKIVQQATIAAAAVEQIGGVSKLTESELARLGVTATEAAAKLRAMGEAVPPGIQNIADRARGAAEETLRLGEKAKGAGDSFGEWTGKFDIRKALSDPLGTAKEGLGAFAEKLGPTGIALTAAGSAAVALGGELIALGTEAEVIGAQIGRMGVQFNIPVREVSDLRFAVKAAGGDFGTFGDSMFTFQKRIEDNAEAVGKGLDKIGLSLNSVKALRPDEQFLAISDAVRSAGSETNKSAVAFEIFGRQGKDILPLLLKPLSDLAEASQKLGATWSEVDVAAAREFRGEVTKLAAETEEAWTSLGRTVAPVTNELVLVWDSTKLGAAQLAAGLVASFGLAADTIRHLTGSTGDLEVTEQELAATQDATNRLFRVAAAEGLAYGDQVTEVATKMLTLGYNQKLVAEQTGLTAAQVRVLAGDLKATATAADEYAAVWERVTKAFEQGPPSLAGVSASTKGLVADMTAAGVSLKDVATATGLTVGQLALLKTEQIEGAVASKKFGDAWIELNAIGTTWKDTIAGINPAMAQQIDYYLQAGASQAVLAAAFPVTASQVKALADRMKEYGEVLKEIQKLEAGRVSAAETGLLGLSRLDQETSQKRMEADGKANGVILQARATLHDVTMKDTLDSTSYQINKIWEVADADVKAFQGTASQRQEYSDIRMQLAQREADAIVYSADTAMNTVAAHGVAIVDAAASQMEARAKQIYNLGAGGKDAGLGSGIDSYGNTYFLQPGQNTFGNQGAVTSSTGLGRVAFRAAGGPVSAGSPYMVGEGGPELFVPSRSGSILPHGSGGGNVTVLVTVQGSVIAERELTDRLSAVLTRRVLQGTKVA